jgi:uncharacterized protein (TIGR02996 family)
MSNATLDEPDDDSLRLIYADALEEAGELVRSNFIRDQMHSPIDGDWRFPLRDACGACGGPDLPHQPHAVAHVKRGFVWWIECLADYWHRHKDTILVKQPVEKVSLTVDTVQGPARIMSATCDLGTAPIPEPLSMEMWRRWYWAAMRIQRSDALRPIVTVSWSDFHRRYILKFPPSVASVD